MFRIWYQYVQEKEYFMLNYSDWGAYLEEKSPQYIASRNILPVSIFVYNFFTVIVLKGGLFTES